MKKITLAAIAAACTFLMGVNATFAQDGPPQFRPVEMWVCNFNDGKDQDDMDDVYEDFVEASGDTAYAGFQINPLFVSGEQDFDFIYLGAWADGNAMGATLSGSAYYDVDEAWDETASCPASLMYASTWIQTMEGGNDPGDFMMTVSDCNIAKGHSAGQAMGALSRYNDYRVANGATVGTIAWFPAYGHGGADFDFKLVNVFNDAQEFGDAFQWFTDNQAYLVLQDMMSGVLACDEARVYNGRTIMNNLQQN